MRLYSLINPFNNKADSLYHTHKFNKIGIFKAKLPIECPVFYVIYYDRGVLFVVSLKILFACRLKALIIN